MNANQLRQLGVPVACVPEALAAIQRLAESDPAAVRKVSQRLREIVEQPERHVRDPFFGALAAQLVEELVYAPPQPIHYQTWGDEIDPEAHAQMRQACGVPSARGAALMPDAHVGYGLPIGGVLACENAVIPYGVGVDIACRMKLSVVDMPVESLTQRRDLFKESLIGGTRFGVGVSHDQPRDHAVMDRDWSITRVTREHRDKAWKQLGTSGSGNHFVEFGTLTIEAAIPELSLAPGEYVALLSHSGSRGAGAAVCSAYSAIAQARLDHRRRDFGRLAWLDLASEAGQEYWAAMNLMGEYAAANHDVIHRLVTKLLGARIIAGVENHHNFAWRELHQGREVIVHRKGATPAGAGVLGVIPGSMADPAFVVRGKGNPASLDSASHGAGRRMSRTKARELYNFNAVKQDLAARGITILSAGADEVPFVYKNILDVMAAQSDLVEPIARFDPVIVRMCDDGSRAED